MEFIRDHTMYAAIFGMFSFVWFGWAQERPRGSWRKYLGIASGIAVLICLVGVYLSINNWHMPSALHENDAMKVYLITVYVEFFLAGVGAAILLIRKLSEYVAPWICLIVGVHFIALVSVFQDPSLYVLAILLIAVAAASRPISRRLQVAASAITGIGAGSSLLAFALLGLIRYVISA